MKTIIGFLIGILSVFHHSAAPVVNIATSTTEAATSSISIQATTLIAVASSTDAPMPSPKIHKTPVVHESNVASPATEIGQSDTVTASSQNQTVTLTCPADHTCTPANQTATTVTSCTAADNTKALDTFLAAHPEYLPANDPTNAKWSLFRSIYQSYNVINVCPTQLTSLLEKTDTVLKAVLAAQPNTLTQQTDCQTQMDNLRKMLTSMNPTMQVVLPPCGNVSQQQWQTYQQNAQSAQSNNQLQQQQQANAQAQQQLQDQINQVKYQQEQQKIQQDWEKELQFQQQTLQESLPKCSDYPIGLYARPSNCR